MSIETSIYEAALDEAGYKTLPTALAKEVGGRAAVIVEIDPVVGQPHAQTYNYYSAALRERYYLEGRSADDPWVPTLANPNLFNRILNLDDYVKTETFKKSTVYNEYSKQYGDDTAHCLAYTIPVQDGVVAIGILNGDGHPFDAVAADRLAKVAPLLRRSFAHRAVARDVAKHSLLLEGALHNVETPILIVDGRLRIQFANVAAERLLARKDVLFYSGSVLSVTDSTEGDALTAAIRSALGRGDVQPAYVQIGKRKLASPLIAAITPNANSAGRSITILIHDPGARQEPDGTLLRDLYGLTEAEVEIARLTVNP